MHFKWPLGRHLYDEIDNFTNMVSIAAAAGVVQETEASLLTAMKELLNKLTN